MLRGFYVFHPIDHSQESGGSTCGDLIGWVNKNKPPNNKKVRADCR